MQGAPLSRVALAGVCHYDVLDVPDNASEKEIRKVREGGRGEGCGAAGERPRPRRAVGRRWRGGWKASGDTAGLLFSSLSLLFSSLLPFIARATLPIKQQLFSP